MGTGPFLLGVTGGMGSGKSSVCRILASLGCRVFEADRVARCLQDSDPQLRAGIQALLGDAIYTTSQDGSPELRRREVASLVFRDKALLGKLNALVHPAVYRAFGEAVDAARHDGVPVLVKEAAILFESGGDKGLDAVLVVTAAKQLRVERAMKRTGLGRDEVLRRIAMQLPQDELERRADYVIENNGTLEELAAETGKVYRAVLSRIGEGVPGGS